MVGSSSVEHPMASVSMAAAASVSIARGPIDDANISLIISLSSILALG